MTDPICETFILIAEACAAKYGAPLPKELLTLGDENHEWGVTLNPTDKQIMAFDPFEAHINWNGFPAGVLNPYCGLIAAGELANEETLCEWLRTQIKAEGVENDV